MKQVAFYAPLKTPDHPVPSGDRLIARLLMQAIQQAGFEVLLASRFSSRDGKGDPHWQQRAITTGQKLAQRLVRRWDREGYQPDAWFTYHLYYKAPDLIGPHIARHYHIPYLVAEASWAGKRATGNWQLFHQQLEAALLQASRIFVINPVDVRALPRFLPDTRHLITLRPFLDFRCIRMAEQLPVTIKPDCPRLITIAMMRSGDKLASYRLLAEAIQYVTQPMQWFMVGDGTKRPQVEALFAADPRVQFCGQLANAQVHRLLAACDLHVWPAVNEAFGMTLLEAQYQSVAILSGDEGGVSSVMADGISGELVPPRDPRVLGEAIQHLLSTPALLDRYRGQARNYVETHHDIQQAVRTLREAINCSIRA